MTMKKRLLCSGNLSVEQEKNKGGFTLSLSPFMLRCCQPVVWLDGCEYPLDSWKISRQTAKKVALSAENSAGRWHLSFAGDGEALVMQLGGTLKQPCRAIKLYYFSGGRVAADHLLSQGMKMGGCQSIPLTGSGKEDFTGYYQLLLTSKGTSLRLSCPLKHDLLMSFSGRSGKKQVLHLQAGTEIRNYVGKKIELPPLSFRIGNGIELKFKFIFYTHGQ